MFLNGEEIAAPDSRGGRVTDDSFLLLFNAHHEDVEFRLPPGRFGARWTCVLRTDEGDPDANGISLSAGEHMTVCSRSMVLLRREV
jgi:glycogen operon protein